MNMEMKQEKGIHLLSETKISHQMTQGIGTVQLLRAVPTVINMRWKAVRRAQRGRRASSRGHGRAQRPGRASARSCRREVNVILETSGFSPMAISAFPRASVRGSTPFLGKETIS
jgi:hypothetical protein